MVCGEKVRVRSAYAAWFFKSVCGFCPSTNWNGSSLYWFTEYNPAIEVLSLDLTSRRARPSAVTMLRGALVVSCRKLTAGRVRSCAGYGFSEFEKMAFF